MKMGSHRKRQREKEIKHLTDRIHKLESLHKQSLTVKSTTKLLDTRKTLQQILETKTKRFLFFSGKRFITNLAINRVGFLLKPLGHTLTAIPSWASNEQMARLDGCLHRGRCRAFPYFLHQPLQFTTAAQATWYGGGQGPDHTRLPSQKWSPLIRWSRRQYSRKPDRFI